MRTLYLCGAGNSEGVRLAQSINETEERWDRLVLLDDDSSKHGLSMLGVEVTGPISTLDSASPGDSEVAHLAGYCGEADANLVGFLAGLRAGDRFARYATALHVFRYSASYRHARDYRRA